MGGRLEGAWLLEGIFSPPLEFRLGKVSWRTEKRFSRSKGLGYIAEGRFRAIVELEVVVVGRCRRDDEIQRPLLKGSGKLPPEAGYLGQISYWSAYIICGTATCQGHDEL